MADDQVDISGMPEPSEIGLDPAKQSDPASDMPSPKDLYIQHHMYDGPTYMNPSQGDLDAFMKNPPEKPHKYTAGEFASAATGLPRVASVYNPVTPIVAGAAGALNALPAAIGAGLDPEHASEHLDTARERLRSGAKSVYDLAQYLPGKLATKRGNEMAEDAMDLPVGAAKETFEPLVRRAIGDNATQAVGDVLSDAATVLPGLGIKGVAKGAFKAGERVASAVKGAPKVAPEAPITPDVGSPVTGDALRSQPNPIPPPEGTVAHEKTKVPPRRGVVTNPPESQPAAANAPENAPNAPENTPNAPENTPNAPENTPPNPTLPESDNAPLDMSLSPDQRAIVREGVAARRRSTDDQRGSVRLFNEPAKEGPQGQSETTPDERTGHLDDLDQLSGGMLPSRRSSAISGDYNATSNDFQMKESDNKQMVDQVKTENAALHKGAENVHQSIGSEFDNSVDPQTLEDRGRVTRTALQGIEKHFGDMTDATYDEARAVHGHSPMPQFLDRASDFLGDEGNYMPDGFRRAAQARLNQLKTKGDNGNGTPNSGAAPSSVGAAEKFREWLNANRTMDNAHVVKQLKDHTDTDVSSQGGAGLFEKARHMRTHQAQMLEEPTLMRQLLTANDSQGINHQVATGKVMDKIADAPTEQVQHLMKVLHAGAHLSPELAESSAAAIREIQAHIVSRAHKAATNADGTWNSRTFYNAASKYGPKMDSVFKDRPDVKKNLKTLNDAGNTLSMDKHYPGAFGQEARTGAVGHIVEAGGKFASGLAHDIPFVGRIVGRAMENAVEGIGGKISESSRDKAVAKSLVDRNGKQRGAVGDLSQRDAVTHTEDRRVPTQIMHEYRTPNSGGLDAVESPELGFRQATMAHIPKNERGQGWGTRTLQRAVDDAHGAGQTWRSDKQVSDGQVGAYKNMMQLGYDVKMKPHEHLGGAYHAYGDHLFEVKPRAVKPPGQRGSFSFQNDNALNNATAAARNKQGGVGENIRNPRTEYNANRQLAGNAKETAERAEILRRLSGQRGSVKVMNEAAPEEQGTGSQLNVGLHQGTEGQKGFRKMSKQEAQAAVESTGAKVTKTSVLTPKQHGVMEPTAVMSTDRLLSNEEMQQVLAKTKQSAIPQRADNGDESMHIQPGHEETAAKEGWDTFNPDYFREHSGQSAIEAANKSTNPGGDAQTKLPAFKQWFGKSQITEPFNSDNKPLVVYHGTTHEFSKFSAKGANPENDFGKGFYFSNHPEDIEANYAGKGPDLTQRIELQAERLEANGMSRDKAVERAHAKLMGHGGMTMPAYVRMENPAIVGDGAHGQGTELTHELEYEDPTGRDDIEEGEIKGETGTLPKFIESLRSVAKAAHPHENEAYLYNNLDGALAALHEKSGFSGISLKDAIDMLTKGHDGFNEFYDSKGNFEGKELIRRALQKMGYDGIIDHTAGEKFGKNKYGGGMKGMNPDTVHYIAFKPNQIKSAVGNSGKFSRKNADITASNNDSKQRGALA